MADEEGGAGSPERFRWTATGMAPVADQREPPTAWLRERDVAAALLRAHAVEDKLRRAHEEMRKVYRAVPAVFDAQVWKEAHASRPVEPPEPAGGPNPRDTYQHELRLLTRLVLDEVERAEKKGFTRDSDAFHEPGEWEALIGDYNRWARRMWLMGDRKRAKRRYIQTAMLALKAAWAVSDP